MKIELLKEDESFGGQVQAYRHNSPVNNCDMQFSIYLPPLKNNNKAPVLTWLSGLTCNEDTFMIKAGAQRMASELGIVIVAPDTSPRGDDIPDDEESAYDFGLGAGFYLDALQDPWKKNYNMYSYVTKELNEIVYANFQVDKNRHGIFGHSMGGHGALTIGLKNPNSYKSISAFAPICNPINCTWGKKALSNYLGDDQNDWGNYDASELIEKGMVQTPRKPVLIDQGLSDEFLERELNTDHFEEVCEAKNANMIIRRHSGYGHGYYFISTFMEDHLKHHAKYLSNESEKKKIPCFGVLGNLILNFSKILNQKASHEPSGQHVLNDEYYDRIEAIQFTMNHDDGNLISEVEKSDIILVGVSRTSKTPTSIYLANKGFKTSNIPLVNENSLPKKLKENPHMTCVVGLSTEPERLADLRKNRMNSLKETENIDYTNLESIKKEVLQAKKTFQKYKWPLIDVTRKSVEETAASIIKIHEIYSNNVK